MNGIMQDIGRGTHKLVAARYTFRRLFLAGLTALLADAVGFAVLMVIDIPVIKDLALTASIGVAVLIFTNLLLLPVLLSYTGVSAEAAERSLQEEKRGDPGQGPRQAVGVARPLHHAAAGRSARSPCRRCWRWPASREHAPARSATSTRARRSCGPTRATTATTRTSPRTTRCRATSSRSSSRPTRKAASSIRRWSRPIASPGRCSRCPACRPRCRWPTRRGRSPPARSRATRSG